MNLSFLQQEYFGNSLKAYLLFVVILLLALILKRYISSILAKLFFTVFKKFSANFYGQQFKTLVLQPIQGIIVSIAFYIAFYQLGSSLENIILIHRMKPDDSGHPVTSMMVTAMDVVDHLFFLFLLFYFILLLSRLLDFVFLVLINKSIEKGDRERQQIQPLIRDVIKVVIWSFGILSVLGVVFHVNVGALIAGLGVGGIAIAFAAKETLENLLASFMVLLDKPFTIGDWVKMGGVEGHVEKIGFRSTRIRTFDKSLIAIPNRKMIDDNLENLSERGMRRVVMTVGAIYGLSRKVLEQLMDEIKTDVAKVEGTTGNTVVHLDSFGDSSVNIQIVYFVKVDAGIDFGNVKQQVLFSIYESMYRHAAGFAYPTQMQLNGRDRNEVLTPEPSNGPSA
ncbi:mechanosensitive ion channel family protein [Taibaiella lutea]|uniref:Mechanosensitive ion channel family protein n=1 Tax=Taibaiella lutea TaxID=2608001 RepID=A0A5M6CMP3_9BACT|nr:mechanosensitive ion channel family protein [Taibaiella lutea]KAA5536297.1 mechanosensitive ion channel family protein [Taibaiella lutea]